MKGQSRSAGLHGLRRVVGFAVILLVLLGASVSCKINANEGDSVPVPPGVTATPLGSADTITSRTTGAGDALLTRTPTLVTPTATPVPTAAVEPTVTPEPMVTGIVTARPTRRPGLIRPSAGPIALTFDCGYNAESLNRILVALADYDVRATFFLEGVWVERSPQIVAPIAADGHEIGSHSYSHRDFTDLTEEEVAYELARTEALVAWAGGPPSLSLFRYPYGARTWETDRWIVEQGYTSIGWSIDPRGWKRGTTSEDVIEAVEAQAESGDIILMHCGSRADEDALEAVITLLQSRGHDLVTVSSLLADTPSSPGVPERQAH